MKRFCKSYSIPQNVPHVWYLCCVWKSRYLLKKELAGCIHSWEPHSVCQAHSQEVTLNNLVKHIFKDKLEEYFFKKRIHHIQRGIKMFPSTGASKAAEIRDNIQQRIPLPGYDSECGFHYCLFSTKELGTRSGAWQSHKEKVGLGSNPRLGVKSRERSKIIQRGLQVTAGSMEHGEKGHFEIHSCAWRIKF